MARTRAADYDTQRDRILARAVEAFAQTGYAAASMAMLAQACGVSKATLYHYYPSKQALLFEALDRYTKRLLSILAATQPPGGLAPREALRGTLRALMAEYRHSRAYHAVLLHDLRFLAPQEAEQIRAQQRAMVSALTELIAHAAPGAAVSAERSVITMALLGMINFTFAWFKPDGAISHERFADLAADLWLEGLHGLANPSTIAHEDSHEQSVRIQG
ncbi:MAG: TetR/AcrR family transcriptional regulator [Betaproteobacteria bacterium]